MSEHPPVVYVDLYKSKLAPELEAEGRPQRWRWRAINAGNQKTLAISSEAYTNYRDCFDSIVELFGRGTNVYLRESNKGDALLRMAGQ